MAASVQASIVADLTTDYRGGIDQNANPTGIPGTVSGYWQYLVDTDADPTNGAMGFLPYNPWLVVSDGYQGSEPAFGFNYPWISLLNQWESTVPAGSLASHPGPSQLLAVKYTATSLIDELMISYRLEKPNWYANDYVAIEKGDGTVLLSYLLADWFSQPNSLISGTLSAGQLLPDESIWLYVGAGSYGDAAGDQTFLSMTLDSVPEPATLLLSLPLVGILVKLRKRR